MSRSHVRHPFLAKNNETQSKLAALAKTADGYDAVPPNHQNTHPTIEPQHHPSIQPSNQSANHPGPPNHPTIQSSSTCRNEVASPSLSSSSSPLSSPSPSTSTSMSPSLSPSSRPHLSSRAAQEEKSVSQRSHRAMWASNTRARFRRCGHTRDKCLCSLFAEMECCLARSWLCTETRHK